MIEVKIISESECVYTAAGNDDADVENSYILLLAAITIRSLTYSIVALVTVMPAEVNNGTADVDALPVKGFLFTSSFPDAPVSLVTQ